MKLSNKNILAPLLFIALFISCDDFLTTPASSVITLNEFWNSSDDAELGVAAIYDDAQSVFENNYWRWGEFRADNYIKSDRVPQSVQQMIDNGLTPTTDGADWGSLYKAIATANMAIDRIPKIPSFSRQNDLLAQALTLRAIFYFYAVRVWGDVPKVTEPIINLNQDLNPSKSLVNEIYSDIILPDLERAEQLIPNARSALRPANEIALGAILALKAHVYMWPGNHQDYSVARDAISQLERLGYTLEITEEGWIQSLFQRSQNSNEIVFALSWNFLEDGGNGGIATFTGATPQWVPPPDLGDKWESTIPNDFRMLETAAFDIPIEDPNEFPLWRIVTKYIGKDSFDSRDERNAWGSTNEQDILFYRLSGLLLLKAEAENYLDNPVEALALINRVRMARGLELVDETITDQATVRDMILDERQFELYAEGHRYWDLVRNNVALEVMEPINGMNSANKILWPISQNVMNRNPNIDQNEGY